MMEMVNPSAAKLFGYEPEELLGKSINLLMPEPDKSRHDGYIHIYQTTGKKKIIGREVTGLRKNGTTFPFYLSNSEVNLADRKEYTGFMLDIIAQELNEEKLRRYLLNWSGATRNCRNSPRSHRMTCRSPCAKYRPR